VEESSYEVEKEEGEHDRAQEQRSYISSGLTMTTTNECSSSVVPLKTLSLFVYWTRIFEDPKEDLEKAVTVPINRVPAVLGRTHNTTDKGFSVFGAKSKALS
jgi:hypothetical protein